VTSWNAGFCSPVNNIPDWSISQLTITSQLTTVHVVVIGIVFFDDQEHPAINRSKHPPATISIFFFMLFVYRKIKGYIECIVFMYEIK
jgi:hypothetical protein